MPPRRPGLEIPGGEGRVKVIIGRGIPHIVVGGVGRRASRRGARRALLTLVSRRLGALVVAVMACNLLVTPVFGADDRSAGHETFTDSRSIASEAPRVVAQQQPRDASDGGFPPPARQTVFPSIEIGLTPRNPIPLGVTCSCTIDRVGLTSQFDITVIEVVQDAYAMVQQLNRFNRPPRPGARYLAAYVGQLYIAGPENQAYSTSESDWKSTATDGRLSDTAQLLHTEIEYRPRADVFPRNYVNGWLIYELPVNRPAYLVWNYNFVGERGIWFALQ